MSLWQQGVWEVDVPRGTLRRFLVGNDVQLSAAQRRLPPRILHMFHVERFQAGKRGQFTLA